MQISKSDPKIKQETYTKYDENKAIDFNSNINLDFKKIDSNEKPLVEDSKTTSKTYSPLLRQVLFSHINFFIAKVLKLLFVFCVQIIASSGPIIATVAAGKILSFLYSVHSVNLQKARFLSHLFLGLS